MAHRGGDFDGWDLELRGGLLGSARVLMTVEEHGGGNQYIRIKSRPRCTPAGIFMTLFLAAMGAASAAANAWIACGVPIPFSIRDSSSCPSGTP
jgi:hypothetical protein